MSKVFSLADVQQHGFLIIDGDVFDVSKFMSLHPGGKSILVAPAGAFFKPLVPAHFGSSID